MEPKSGRVLLKNYMKRFWNSWSLFPSIKKISSNSRSGMVSSVEKDGSQHWTLPSIKASGASAKIWTFCKSGWMWGTNGEKLPTWSMAEQSHRSKIDSIWFWDVSWFRRKIMIQRLWEMLLFLKSSKLFRNGSTRASWILQLKIRIWAVITTTTHRPHPRTTEIRRIC